MNENQEFEGGNEESNGATSMEDDVVFPDEGEDEGEAADAAETQDSDPELSELETARIERGRMKDQLLRIAADFDNFRKRSRREMEDTRQRAVEDTLREVLPVVDNLERAAQAARETTDVQALAEGVDMVLRGFEDIASRLGLVRVACIGERFDPAVHDAMQQIETDEHPPGAIVAEIVPGYRIGEKLLRPAMVVVARPRSGASSAKEEAEESAAGEDESPKIDSE